MLDPNLTTLIHNLRNQLNNIAMNAELAKLELNTLDTDDDQISSVESAIDCLESILSQCLKSAELLNKQVVDNPSQPSSL